MEPSNDQVYSMLPRVYRHRHWKRRDQQRQLTTMLRGFYQYFLGQQGVRERSVEFAGKAIELNPSNAQVHLWWGDAIRQLAAAD